MPVLKQTNSRGAMKEALVLDLGDLGRQAARLRMQAEAKAAAIVTDAQGQAQALIETASTRGFDQGRHEGHAQGLAKGREEGRAEALAQTAEHLTQLQTVWSEAAARWDADRKQIQRQAQQTVLDFALKMAERLVHRVIEVDDKIIVDQIGHALSHVLRPLDVTVKINPADRPLLDDAMPKLAAELPNLEHVHLIEDEQISRGGCVVSYGQGEIDATIETQIRRVVEMIMPGV